MLTVHQPIYIRSAACVSPRQGEPDYKTLLDPKLLRRMSRIIRIGAATALTCLREAGIDAPDAIVTGTAYGCLEDTGIFLNNMIERHEELLQPATFIQSTHNTVGAQIALLLGCTGYNNTFVHRGFSFESALLDAILLLADGEAETVLLGGVDELTETSRAILARFRPYRRTIAGEGAAFFLLTPQPSPASLARLDGFETFYTPGTGIVERGTGIVERGTGIFQHRLMSFLDSKGLTPEDIDLIITGDNGDKQGDYVYREISASLFPGTPSLAYKQLCGEYPTSASFALWMAARHVRSGAGRVLIYNHYLGIYHSVYLLSHVAE